ncbi:MAG: hypothetical protein U9R54_09995, partial [Bacteroidota bacterium]|nr:hypothetical protein [Bacteroidota bacterium]
MMNLSFQKKLLYIFIVIAVSLFAGVLCNNISWLSDSKKYYNEFQEIFNEKEDDLDLLVSDIKLNINKKNLPSLFEKDLDVENKDFGILVYNKNKLEYWSGNSIPIDELQSLSIENESVVKLKNAWYYYKEYKISEQVRLVGLILIKNVYSYQNEFIKSEFCEDFNFPSKIKIFVDEKGGNSIYNSSNKYVFSLSSNSDIQFRVYLIYLSAILYFISIIFILFLIKNLLWEKINKNYLKLLLLGLFILGIRYIMLKYRIPKVFYGLDLFKPHHFATSAFIPSLGDLLLHSLFLIYYLQVFYFKFNFSFSKIRSRARYLIASLLFLLTFLLFLGIINLFRSLIINSSISFAIHKFFDLSIYSFIAYLIILLLLFTFYLFSDKVIRLLKTIISFKESI